MKLTDHTCAINHRKQKSSISVESCFEKARPEKKTGIVKIAGIKNFNNTEGMLVKSKYVT